MLTSAGQTSDTPPKRGTATQMRLGLFPWIFTSFMSFFKVVQNESNLKTLILALNNYRIMNR